jgi:hypothetical protein
MPLGPVRVDVDQEAAFARDEELTCQVRRSRSPLKQLDQFVGPDVTVKVDPWCRGRR